MATQQGAPATPTLPGALTDPGDDADSLTQAAEGGMSEFLVTLPSRT